MLTQVLSAGLEGVAAYPVDVEVDIQNSHLPLWKTVGLAESAVRESHERVVAAIKNSDYQALFRKVIINLAPADKRKEGTAFDLPIAVGLLVASGLLPSDAARDTLLVGELGLSGDLRGVKGVLPIAILAKARGCKRLVIPQKNHKEARLVAGLDVFAFSHLTEVVEFLRGAVAHAPLDADVPPHKTESAADSDLAEVAGQLQAKRALEIAAAGGHNLLFCGPPGSGKTMLASRLPTILPPLTFAQALETTAIYSVAGFTLDVARFWRPPFRSPHHSVSYCGLLGGGSHPRPGEISLAHNGVLFLDEIFEFQRQVLEQLRQPLESHAVTISRAAQSLTYPARFLMVASCNPCPCGYKGHPQVTCRCSLPQIQKYQGRLSGPLLDRMDLQVDVPPISYEEFRGKVAAAETSQTVLQRVLHARDRQAHRFKALNLDLNSQMTAAQWKKFCILDSASETLLKAAMEKFHLSARGVGRVLKVARTIADLGGCEQVDRGHLSEALQYRRVEWQGLGKAELRV